MKANRKEPLGFITVDMWFELNSRAKLLRLVIYQQVSVMLFPETTESEKGLKQCLVCPSPCIL